MELVLRVDRKLKLRRGTRKKLIASIRRYFKKHGMKQAVLGLSGGIDSAVICSLLVNALGSKNVFPLYLPVRKMKRDEDDARAHAQSLGLKLKKINLNKAVSALNSILKPSGRVSKGNITARARMVALYNFAKQKRALVVGTGNKTELLLGYFTKYGDGGVDVLPVGKLYKAQVRSLARELDISSEIILKVPTAGLWEGQSDEVEIGASYGEIDFVLCAYFELRVSKNQIKKFVSERKVNRILSLAASNDHKLTSPPVLTF